MENRLLFAGYLFSYEPVILSDVVRQKLPEICGKLLILNPIPENSRLGDISLLEKGNAAGKAAEASGRYYHPVVNGFFDEASKGFSWQIQLYSLMANAKLAQALC